MAVLTYRIVRVRDGRRALTRAVHVGTVDATSKVEALAAFRQISGTFYKLGDLDAEPAKRAA